MPLDRQRTNDNAVIDFSIKQLALLFRLDPKGVTYYVSNKVLQGDTSQIIGFIEIMSLKKFTVCPHAILLMKIPNCAFARE